MLLLRKNILKNSLLYCILPFHRHFLYGLLHFTTMHIAYSVRYITVYFPQCIAATGQRLTRRNDVFVCLSVHCIVSDLPRRGGALCSVASLKASLPYRSWRTRRSMLIIMCVPDPRRQSKVCSRAFRSW